MSFLPLTSLVPTVVALSAFFFDNFPSIDWYPYWYLGNPFFYLIGPVIPLALSVFHLIGFPFSSAYVFLIMASVLYGGVGIYFFSRTIGLQKRYAVIAGIFYSVAPGGWLLLHYQDGLHHIVFGLLPFLLLLYKRFLERRTVRYLFAVSLSFSFLLLITVSVLLPLLITVSALIVVYSKKEYLSSTLLQIVFTTFLAVSLATLWYTPGFWLTIFVNPSFGGVPLYRLIWSLVDFALQLLPLVLAVVIIKWRGIKAKGPLLFGVLVFFSFFYLTIIRFIADPDFVIDWIGFLLELQFGMAVIIGSILGRFSKKRNAWAFLAGIFVIVILLNGSIVSNLAMQQFSNSGHAYQQRILTILKENVPEGERVFLSGTPVFWVNAFIDQPQVRGGNDSMSVHPFWAQAAFQIREGKDPSISHDLLLALGSPYVLVHRGDSEEKFDDFKVPLKFDSTNFVKVTGGDDALYKLNKAQSYGTVRVADVRIISMPKPKGGNDSAVIHDYVSSLKESVPADFQKPNMIVIKGNLGEGEIFSFSVAYHPSWRIDKGKGRLQGDSLGNIAIVPEKSGEQQFAISFHPSIWDIAVPIFASLVFCIVLLYHETVSQFFRKRVFSRLSLGFSEHDEE